MRFLLVLFALSAASFSGQTSAWSDYFVLSANTTAIEDASFAVPGAVSFSAAPNPFNPSTVISINNLREASGASLFIYDVRGRIVADFSSRLKSGNNKILWNAGNIAGGLYVAKLRTAGGRELSRKIMLVK